MTSQEAIAQLTALAEKSPGAMRNAELVVANEIAVTAIGLAPEELGQLVNSIEVLQGENAVGVAVNAPHAAFVEFGTGEYAADYVSTLPDEWKEEARKFFVNGLGRQQAHPYFYPAVQRHQDDIIPELDKQFSKLAQ